ncbi:MAG: VanW family protein [Tumebacillaceae bacterium]
MRKALKVWTGVVIVAGAIVAGGWYVWPQAQAFTNAQLMAMVKPTTPTKTPHPQQPPQTSTATSQTDTTADIELQQMKIEQQQAQQRHQAYLASLPTAHGKQVATFNTSLAGHSATGRVQNIDLAAHKISGKILMPGDTFSFNAMTGDSNRPEDGWQLATVIVGQQFEQGYGGGICQVSSTLYNAVQGAGLEVVERTSHSLPVGYVQPGHDATVSYPELDFKFRNTLQVPVRVEVKVANGNVYANLYTLPAEA